MLKNMQTLDIFGNVVVWLTYLNILYKYITCQEHEPIRSKLNLKILNQYGYIYAPLRMQLNTCV